MHELRRVGGGKFRLRVNALALVAATMLRWAILSPI